MLPPATRVVGRDGGIHLARHRYAVGRWLAGETVEIVYGDALVEVFHRRVLIVSHVARHQAGATIVNRKPVNALARRRRPRPGDSTATVTRLVDGGGSLSFAGAAYKVGRSFARRSVQVGVLDGQVVISLDGQRCAPTPSATTAPRSTAHWPTRTDGPANAARPPNHPAGCQARAAAGVSSGSWDLTLFWRGVKPRVMLDTVPPR